jgi:hypothetical protein
VDLGFGHVGNERSDKHGGFSLTDERGSGSDNSLGSSDTHSPENEGSELSDEPLDETNVVESLDERDKDWLSAS